jgi:hypothetical protein
MVNPNRFYTYAYLREDRTPYYIGKGKGNRVCCKHKCEVNPPKDKSRIIFLKQNLTEEEAFKHEIYMIAVFGRKDLGTGILRNRTNGGEGGSGVIFNEERRKKISEKKRGEHNPSYGKKWWNDGKGNNKFSKECPGQNWIIGMSEEFKKNQSKINKNTKWWNDENGNLVRSVECPGERWFPGMGEESKRNKLITRNGRKSSCYGRLWWNDGCGNSIRSVECPGESWVVGQSEEHKRKMSKANKNKKWWNDEHGNTKFAEECPGEVWVLGRGKIKRNELNKDT